MSNPGDTDSFVLNFSSDDASKRKDSCMNDFEDGPNSGAEYSRTYVGDNKIANYGDSSQGIGDDGDYDDDDQVLIMPLCDTSEALVDSFDIVASPLFDNDDVGYDSDSSDSPEELFQDEYYEEERVVGVVTTDVSVSNDGKVVRPRRKLASFIVHRIRRPQLDKDEYMSRRTMSSFQERMNGLSMLPGAVYCLYYTLSGMWLFDNVDQVHPNALESIEVATATCRISTWILQDLYVMPPLPVIFIAIGVVAHAPFSFVYHWHYCTTLPPGKPRFDHWSRKLDQAFIHVTSAFLSYGTSGSWDFFMANVAFNAHCVWRNLVSKTVSKPTEYPLFQCLFLFFSPYPISYSFNSFYRQPR